MELGREEGGRANQVRSRGGGCCRKGNSQCKGSMKLGCRKLWGEGSLGRGIPRRPSEGFESNLRAMGMDCSVLNRMTS